MSHTPQCRTYKEKTGNIWVHYSHPDPACTDASHTDTYTQETQ